MPMPSKLLIPASSRWSGTVGLGLTKEEFATYCQTVDLTQGWKPRFLVLHNTGMPTVTQWPKTPGVQRMKNLTTYYRDQQHWSAGPHVFIAPDLIWLFTPLTIRGIHSPSFNNLSWGVEVVGDFRTETPSSAHFALIIDTLVILCTVGRLEPYSLIPHKDDPKTTHRDCPGKNLNVELIREEVRLRKGGPPQGDHDLAADRFVGPKRS